MALFVAGVLAGLLLPVVVRLVESVLDPSDDPFEWYDEQELWTGADVRRRLYEEEE